MRRVYSRTAGTVSSTTPTALLRAILRDLRNSDYGIVRSFERMDVLVLVPGFGRAFDWVDVPVLSLAFVDGCPGLARSRAWIF